MTPRDRFSAKVIPEPNSGCWLWSGAVNSSGYGSFLMAGKTSKAHRTSYRFYVGPIPNGLHVLHRCDNRICVNPDHLFVGTRFDNMRDMVRKKRLRGASLTKQFGEANGSSVLTSDDVLNIRASATTSTLLAAKYSVSDSLISLIRSRKIWTHI